MAAVRRDEYPAMPHGRRNGGGGQLVDDVTTVVIGVALLENHLLMRQLSYGELMLGTTSLFTFRYNVVAIYSVRE